MDSIIFGGLIADRYFNINKYPNRGSDAFITGEKSYVGGCAINMAAAINNLGGRAHVVSYVGNDKTGTQIMSYMKKNGFSTEFVKTSEGANGYSMVLKEPDGEKTFITKKGVEEVFDPSLLEKVDSVNPKTAAVTGYYLLNNNAALIMDCLEILKVSGVKILFDPGPFVEYISPDILKRIIKISRVITPNESEMDVFKALDKNFIDNFAKGKNIIVLKRGVNGGTVYREGDSFSYKSVSVNTVDSTGAGDSFAGALVFAMGNRIDIHKAVELAAICAAKTVQIEAPHGFWKIKEV